MARVWKVPSRGVNNHLTTGCIKKPYKSAATFYGLFRYDAFNRRWNKCRSAVFTSEKIAFQVFKADICNEPLSLQIRIVRNIGYAQAQGITHFPSHSYKIGKEFVQSEHQSLSGK